MPALSARTVPPCSSIRCRTMARPRPRPPCSAAGRGVGLAEAFEDVRQELAIDADAGVLHDDLNRSPVPRRAPRRDRPPASLNLTAFDSRFQTTCCSRSASPSSDGRLEVMRTSSSIALGVGGRPHRVERRVDDGARDRPRPELEAQLPGDDARHVEDVVDQLRLQLGVALDHFERAPRGGGSSVPSRSIRLQPRIALSGVRSSCESVARNSSFARFAALRLVARWLHEATAVRGRVPPPFARTGRESGR